MRKANSFSKLGGERFLLVALELEKVQSELAKLPVFPESAPVIGRACLDCRVTGGRLSSQRAWPLRAERRGKEGRMGRKNNLWTCPFWDSNCSSPVPRIIANSQQLHPTLLLLSANVTAETSVVSRSLCLYTGNRGNSWKFCGVWAALDFTVRMEDLHKCFKLGYPW